MTDPIADFLIRIKNGYRAGKGVVTVPSSKVKQKLAQILLKEGFLAKVQKKAGDLELTLKYEGREPALTEVKRISKPGRRVYSQANKIPQVRRGYGITLISTPKGLMTGALAKKKNLGGEVIGQVW